MEDREISDILIRWYEENKRDLPWRRTSDPYLIWISEIILQQTRVVQGLEYFNRFTERFPNVAALAMADEDEVMKYWQGLGYYSRARNLHAAARRVERLPVKSGKTVVKPRYFNYLYIHGQGMTLLSKRMENDIWRNLYEFPLIETECAVTWGELSGMAVFQELFDGIEKVEITREYVAKKHVLSHRVIYPVFYEIRVDSFSESMGKYLKVSDNRVGEYAVSRLIQSYFEVRDGLLF